MVAAMIAAGFVGGSAFSTGANMPARRSAARSAVSMQVSEAQVASPVALAKVRGARPPPNHAGFGCTRLALRTPSERSLWLRRRQRGARSMAYARADPSMAGR